MTHRIVILGGSTGGTLTCNRRRRLKEFADQIEGLRPISATG